MVILELIHETKSENQRFWVNTAPTESQENRSVNLVTTASVATTAAEVVGHW